MESPLPFALSRVFGRIDPEQFEECFRTWTREAYEQTDGEVVHSNETLRRILVADKCIDAKSGFVSSCPLYEIEDLPPRSYVSLPSVTGGHLLDLSGKQFWEVKHAEWTDGKRVEGISYPEAKRLCGAEFSETCVEREVRRLGTIPANHLGEEPGELSTPGKRHTQKLKVYRDTGRTLYLINAQNQKPSACSSAATTTAATDGGGPKTKAVQRRRCFRFATCHLGPT